MHVLLAYKNFAANRAISHIGLGVTALNSAKMLRGAGITAEVLPIASAADIRSRLRSADATHVVISAPWIATADLARLCHEFNNTQFAVTCHSNLGFLQADPNAMRLLREGLELRRTYLEFPHGGELRAALQRGSESAYGTPCQLLPNMYHLDGADPKREPLPRRHAAHRRVRRHPRTQESDDGRGRGACKSPMPNAPTSNSGSPPAATKAAGSVVEAVRQMMHGLPHVKLVENGWQTWPQFRQTVRHMHLLLQPSYTESFNVVTADGVAEGVPSVVSDAIEWAPGSWKAPVDNACAIADTGRRLLHSRRAAAKGLAALKAHNNLALRAWSSFLGNYN